MSVKRIIAGMLAIMCLFSIITSTSCTISDNSKKSNEPGEAVESETPSPSPSQTSTAAPTPTAAPDNANGNSENGEEASETGQEEQFTKPVFSGENAGEYVLPAYEPPAFTAAVQPYSVKKDLSNIENLDQFGEFTDAQKKKIAENGFMVATGQQYQLFYIYETNSYMKLPGFISTDSVLQVYHIFFDYSLRNLEAQKLLGSLEELTSGMLEKSIYLYGVIENQNVKAAALKNISFFAAAQMELNKELPAGIPEDAMALAEKEKALIDGAEGFGDSPLLGYKLDYSQFKPRGHYTRSEELQRYFKAMMWYGYVPFNLLADINGEVSVDKEPTAMALLMTYGIFMGVDGESDIQLWENIYDPTVFYVGSADDLTIYDYRDLLTTVFGNDPDLNSLMDEDKTALLLEEAKKLPEPRIQPAWVTVNTTAGKQFRFMGQRYIPDSDILQSLVSPERLFPSGLDVMGVLGSDRAYGHLTDGYGVDKSWPGYPEAFQKVKGRFSELPPSTWQSNMYYGWLWTLKALLAPFGKGYPSFMTNAAWEDKSLSTALSSWGELRHDTILYGKQSGAEGGGDEPPLIPSYVEPNVELYQKLLWLTRYSRENLVQRGILPDDIRVRMEDFETLLGFLSDCSVKELNNEELSQDDYYRLLNYGSTIGYMTLSMAEGGPDWYNVTSDTDKNMAVVADVHTVPGSYLEEGIGEAAEMFVVVPIGGKLYLTRGAAFDYYEFISNTRLTDEEWQQMLKDNKQPPQPEWTKSFKEGTKSEIPMPEDPYNPGP